MLAGTSGRGAGATIRTVSMNYQRSLNSSRLFSSFTAARTTRSIRRPTVNDTPFRQSQAFAPCSLISSPRFFSSSNSTTSDSTPSTHFENSIQSITDAVPDITQIPEHIGYLKSLGLDYGHGPSSLMQMLLESIHIYTGLPWWGSTIAAAVLIRLALLKPTIAASHTGAKLRELQPVMKPVQERMLQAVRQGNNIEGLKAKQELALIREQNGIKMWTTFVPMIQIPLGFGFFRVLRGMSSLPVPALLDEHILWFSDLTRGDPFFLLPLITGGAVYLALKRGGDTGMALLNSPAGKLMVVALPLISASTMFFWPGILQLYFATTGLLGVGQAFLITSPGFRRFAGLAPLPKNTTGGDPGSPNSPSSRIRTIPTTARVTSEEHTHESQAYPAKQASFIDRTLESVKGTFHDLQKQVQDKMDEATGQGPEKNPDGTPKAPPRLSKQETENADAYEKRRKEQANLEREARNQRIRDDYNKKHKKSNIE